MNQDVQPYRFELPPAPPPVPPAPANPPREVAHPFRFTGNASEYFGIWIVNLFLSIVTLGIYSAWAKVRKKRYFYGNTWVGDSNFEYHGNPVAILKGRIIAVLALAAYSAAGYFSPKLGVGLFLLLAACSPWFIARTMAFNAHYSSYRQIRFRNTATATDVLKAIWPFLLVPLASLLLSPEVQEGKVNLTSAEWFGLFLPMLIAVAVYPYVFGAIKRVHVNTSQYGHALFEFHAPMSDFYKVYFKAYALGIVALICLGVAAAVTVFVPGLFMVVIVLGYIGVGALVLGYLRSRVANLVFQATTLDGDARFGSRLEALGLMKLYFVNLIAITVSLGFLVPWAAIRIARYRAECLTLYTPQDLDAFVAHIGQEVSATGEEVGEFFDLDLSL